MYLEQVSLRVFAATQACCQPVLHSNTEQGTTLFCKNQCGTTLKVGHCTHVFRASLHSCFAATAACCQPVLHSSAEQGITVFCKDQSVTALKVGHCTHVFRASLLTCFCSNSSLLSACIAQQCRAGDYCILQRSVCHCTEGGPLHTCI